MLKVDLRPGQSIQVGDATIRLVKKSGQVASLVIDADKSVPIKTPGSLKGGAPSAVPPILQP